MAVVSLLIGLLVNAWRPQPLPLVYHSNEERLRTAVDRLTNGEPRPQPSPAAGLVRDIGLDEFQALVNSRRGVVIDARPAFIYRDGHVPGAINLPRDDFESAYRRNDARLTVHKAGTVAVYCSGADCPDASLVADALRTLGYSQPRVYTEGWEEWSQSGLPQEK